jgi:hypothetical protein
MLKWGILLLALFLPVITNAQIIRLSGKVQNIHSERLPSAQVLLLPDSSITLTDLDGNFSFQTTPGKKIIIVSFVGYSRYEMHWNATQTATLEIVLNESISELKAVTVETERDRQQELFNSNQSSTNVLDKEAITSIPVLMGEADVIKTLQLLPGTIRGVEGSSDLFVRGGAADQNLVLLDGAPVYNTSHLFGFLSVFNPDILDYVESINGGFPARFGGRLSSILNVNTTSDVTDKTHVSGDIGLIASRLFIEQPVVKDRVSFWIAGRRTYIDRVVRAVGEELPYFFYDVNGKLIVKPNTNDHVELSFYSGDDVLDLFRDRNNDGNGMLSTYKSGNQSQSLLWKRQFAPNLSTSLSLVRSAYRYDIRNIFEDNELIARSDIEDYNAKWLLRRDSLFHGNGTFEAGLEWTRHEISPNVVSTTGIIAELLQSSATQGRFAHELAVHAAYEWSPFERLRVNTGVRLSSGIVQGKTYYNPEPRLSARYALTDDQALKVSYSRMAQYIHRISNSAISMPTDIWYPVTDSIKPQTAHQLAAAWQYVPNETSLFFSIEAYYKSMADLVGYEEGTNLFLNTDFASRLIQGRGKAYGFEFLVRKNAGKFSGWISYTLSWSYRQYDQINRGDWFFSRYDRRHNGAIVLQYELTRRLTTSIVWEYISGSRFTPIIGQYTVVSPTLTGVDVIPVFSEINSVKLADAHRLDVGLKFKSKLGRKFQWHWFAGVYNVYNRATPVGIVIVPNEQDGSLSYQQPGLFGLLPFISYGFKL